MSTFRFQVRVYYEDVDVGGVVYYANYLRYFERARSEWLRSLGVNQERLAAVEGIGFVVAPTSVNGGRSSLIERAAGPSPIMMSIW